MSGAGEMEEVEEVEEVDAIPVLAGESTVVRASAAARALITMAPGVQAAAVAASGFVAGAAVVGLVGRRRSRSRSRSGGRLTARGRGKQLSRGGELLQIVGSRSVLLDVHLLGGRSD